MCLVNLNDNLTKEKVIVLINIRVKYQNCDN